MPSGRPMVRDAAPKTKKARRIALADAVAPAVIALIDEPAALRDVRVRGWVSARACGNVPTEVFMHCDTGERGTGATFIDQARQYCATCPVWLECLAYAVIDPSVQGVWGGTTTYERREIRRRARLELGRDHDAFVPPLPALRGGGGTQVWG